MSETLRVGSGLTTPTGLERAISVDVQRQSDAVALLALALSFRFASKDSNLDRSDGHWQVAVHLEQTANAQLVELFEVLSEWLNKPNSSDFLFERAIQLQAALDTRIVIEQAKGIVAA